MGYKLQLAGLLASAGIVASAFAGGIEAPPLCAPFEGVYAGVGGGWGLLNGTNRIFQRVNQQVSFNRNVRINDDHYLVSLFGGYGHVINNTYYLGGEAHLAYNGFVVNNFINVFGLASLPVYTVQNKWNFGLDFMPGYLVNNKFMIFGKIGYRAGIGRIITRFHRPGFAAFENFWSGWVNGLNLGLGMQYAITDRVSARIEYNYTWYSRTGDHTFIGPLAETATRSASFNTQEVLVGLSYNFCGI